MARKTQIPRLRIPTPTFDYTEHSDNTRVAPIIPRQVQRILANLPKMYSFRESFKNVEEERRIAELAEERRIEEEKRREERRKEEAERKKKRDEERKKEDIARANQNIIRDKDYQYWLEDVEKNGDQYSSMDRAMASLRKSAGRISNLSPVSQGVKNALAYTIPRIWFDVKDLIGAGVLNSIEMNGETMIGKISHNDLMRQAAEKHKEMMDYQEALENVKLQRDQLVMLSGITPEQAASRYNDPAMKDFLDKYNDFTSTIGSIENRMKDPELKQLDDLYKQTYSLYRGGLWDTAKRIGNSIKDQFTYDQYKDYVDQKRKSQAIEDYDKTVRSNYSGMQRAEFMSMSPEAMLEQLNKRNQELQAAAQRFAQGDNFGTDEAEESRRFREADRYLTDMEIKNTNYENELLQKEYKDNREHLFDSKAYWKVRDSFRKGEEAYQNASLLSPYYWLYEMPGMMGSSMSSPSQGVAYAIQYGSTLASLGVAAAGGGAVAPLIHNLGQVAALPFEIRSGYDENHGERGMKRVNNIIDCLKDPAIGGYDDVIKDLKAKSYNYWKEQGKTEALIKEYLYGNDGDKNAIKDNLAGLTKANNDLRYEKALVMSTAGLSAQYWANNMRTMGERFMQTAMMMTPTKRMSSAVAFEVDKSVSNILGKEFVNEVERNTAGRVTARTAKAATEGATEAAKKAATSKYKNTFSESVAKGYGHGAIAGEVLGFGMPGQVVFGTAGAAIRGAAYMTSELLPSKMKGALSAMGVAASNKYGVIFDKLTPTKEWTRLAAQYGIRTAKSTAVSAMSEAAEEAVQYLNEKDNFAKKYGWGYMNIADLIVNDFAKGKEVLKSYLSLLGIADSPYKDDAEYWANLKGGFALGGLHTGAVVAFGNANQARQQYTTTQAIVKSAVLNREFDKINRAVNMEFARQAMANREPYVITAIESMRDRDAKKESPDYSPEDYEERLSSAHRVMALAKNKHIRDLLKNSGIKYGTEKYAVAIADLYNLQEQMRENIEARRQGGINIQTLYNSPAFNKAIQDGIDSRMLIDEEFKDLTGEEREEAINNIGILARESAHVMNKLSALIKLRAQHNTIEDFYSGISEKFGINPMRPDAKTIRENIDSQIELAKKQMKEFYSDFDATTDADVLDYINNIRPRIEGTNEQEIESQEQSDAMLNADAAVIQSYLSQLGTERYGKRIDAIMEANDRNAKLNWMVNDIYEGDAVNKLMSDFAAEDAKNAKEEAKEEEIDETLFLDPFEEKYKKIKESIKSGFDKNKKKYQERLQRAKDAFLKRKERYKNWKRGNLNSTVIPFQDAIVNASNILLKNAEEGAYKFAQFVEDIKEIAGNIEGEDIIPLLKRLYRRRLAKHVFNNNTQVISNMSTEQEIDEYLSPVIDTTPDQQSTGTKKTIQKAIEDDSRNIIEEVSSYFDAVVQEGDNVVIYPNQHAIASDGFNMDAYRIRSVVEQLSVANDSEQNFKQKLQEITKYIPSFPVDEYVKYRNVDGIFEAIARKITTYVKNDSILDGIKAQNIVISILLGKEISISNSELPENINAFITEVKRLKNKIDALGFTILNTNKYVYGTLDDGTRSSGLADIIASDKDGNIYVFDVRSGFREIRSRYESHNSKMYGGSIKANEEAMLNNIEQILINKYTANVKGLYCFPVIYNFGHILLDKDRDGYVLIPAKMYQTPGYSDNLGEQRSNASNIVDKINENIDAYNGLIENAKLWHISYEPQEHIQLEEYQTAEEYSVYIEKLLSQYNDLVEDISNINDEITDIEIEVWTTLHQQDQELPENVSSDLYVLEEACNELDTALQYIPQVKATTKEERENVKKIYQTIFDAQIALDNILQNPNAQDIDVTSEMELIAKAMEDLVSNTDNFKNMSLFMQRWWLNDFVFGTGTRTQVEARSEYEKFYGFVTKINSWVNTLYTHVIDDLDNHRKLQIWYSSLLNNYFSTLLDNAEEFANSLGENKPYLDAVVQKGRGLIDRFNRTWGAPTDENFPGPPENNVERINRMPVKHMDYYGMSTALSPSVIDMGNDNYYYYMSITPGFAQDGYFNLYKDKKTGEVRLYIRYKDQSGKVHDTDLGFMIDINSITSPELIERFKQLNRNNQRFVEKISAMLDYIEKNPTYKIDFVTNTNKGSILYSDQGTINHVSDFLFKGSSNEHDLYTVSLSAKDNIGIGVFTEDHTVPGGRVYYNVNTGSNLQQHLGNFDDVYLKQHLNTRSGLIIYFYDTGDGQKIGVPLISSSIGQDVAKRLTYLIELYINGQRQYEGYDILSLLSQRLYMYDEERLLSTYNNVSNMITINTDGITIGKTQYNIVTQKNDIINAIASMSNVTSAQSLNQRFISSDDKIIKNVRERFANGTETSITLPNGFTFKRDDFVHKNSDGSVGSTMLGYLLRNGIIGTRANGLGYKQLNLDNIRLVKKSDETETSTVVEQTESETSSQSFDEYLEDMYNSFVMNTVEEEKVDVNRPQGKKNDFITYTTEYFNKVLGKNAGKIVFTDSDKKYLFRASDTEVVMGKTTDSMIELSVYAPYSTAHHEAFHKIVELILPAEERESFYKLYREHVKNGRNMSDRDVAEGLADLFTDYSTGVILLKNAPWYKKPFKWFNTLRYMLGMAWNMGPSATRKMYRLYRNINAGEYANGQYSISKESADRFNKLFGEDLFYKIENTANGHSEDFKYIADSNQLHHMVRALAYYILESRNISSYNPDLSNLKIDDNTPNIFLAKDINGKSIMDNLCGTELPEDKITTRHLAFREIFEYQTRDIIENGEKVGTTRTYPKFDAISKYIYDYVISMTDEHAGKIRTEEEEDSDIDVGENQDVTKSNIDKYDRASYEFNKLENVNKKVKLFLATIPHRKINEKGEISFDLSKNMYNSITYMPLQEVYNKIVTDLGDTTGILDFTRRLGIKATKNPMYRDVYEKWKKLIVGAWKKDKDGNVVIDYEKEAFAIQIVSAIRSQRMDFVVAYAKEQEDNSGKEINISTSSSERDAKTYPQQWTDVLLSGQIGVFARTRIENKDLLFADKKLHPNGTDTFHQVSKFINEFRTALLSSGEHVIEGKTYNIDSTEDLNALKKELVLKLHSIGIMIQEEAIDYKLENDPSLISFEQIEENKAENFQKRAMINWLFSRDYSSVNTFIDKINSFVYPNGQINQEEVKKGYLKIGFVKDLATWQGKYNRVSTQQTALGLDGKTLNTITQNNSLSHLINILNSGNINHPIIKTLTGYGYNMIPGEIPLGSMILKGIINKSNRPLKIRTLIGFKTTNKGDNGASYIDQATVDDYMAKYTSLQHGYMLMPTLADKSTWGCIEGVDMPGIKYTKRNTEKGSLWIITNVPTVRFINKEAYIIPSDDVLSQMLEYAKTERLAIQRCMADLGYKNIPGYEDEGRVPIPKEAYIANYHTKENGTRFFGLTQLVVVENGKIVKYNLNDPNKSNVDLLKLANEKFFDKSIEELKEIMALTLNIQIHNEVKTALNLGLISRERVVGQWKDSRGNLKVNDISEEEDGFYNLTSEHLNNKQIDVVTEQIMMSMSHGEFGTWDKIPTNINGDNIKYKDRISDLVAEKQFRYNVARSLAIVSMLGDATIKHIMSVEEALRCFIGNPAFFKVLYDKSKGQIKDSAYDIQKRIGGLISTGQDNIVDIPGMISQYICAECEDYEVASTANVVKNLEEMFITSQVRDVYGIITGNWKNAFNKTAQELIDESKSMRDEEGLPEEVDLLHLVSSLEKALVQGKKFADAYKEKINVADGAAYITDKMYERMLRIRGAYSDDIKKAFEILRSEDTKYGWLQKKEAYDLIYEKTNIVTTKYTAYGFRPHISNNDQVSDTAVPYYDKFALFPLFPSIAVGNMKGIYEKMLEEGVDMLMMTSGVKLGSLGAVEYKDGKIEHTFNKYLQDIQYLRRQLNTDPEEGSKINVGTQMMKIGLQNLRMGRTNYKDVNTGEDISGEHIFDNFMGAIKRIAGRGADTLDEQFLDENRVTVDEEKLSKYLTNQLNSRNANKALTESVKLVTDPNTGNKRMKGVLSATADASWIESILISTVNSEVIDISMPGASYVQRSIFAMEENDYTKDKIESLSSYNGKKLQMINEDGSMDAVISIAYFDRLFGKSFSGKTFEEKRQWLIDNNIIGENAKANTIGYRIPTQAQSSIHALRFIDVVSGVQDTIILPEEFTRITGSDFDIDHLYLISYNYNVNEDNTVTKEFEEGDKQDQNIIIDSLMTLLKDVEYSLSSLYKSIDNDTEPITDIAKLIEEQGSTKHEAYNFGTLHEQVIRKNDYITGKKGISPFALNSVNQSLTTQVPVSFKNTRFTEETGIHSFNNLVDDDGIMISSWLSGFINAHVDIVKDPYISKVDVNPFTYNMLNLLIRSGYGEVSVWFLAQPIIRKMSEASSRAKSLYTRDLERARSTYAAEKLAIEEAVLSYLDEEEVSQEVIDTYTKNSSETSIDSRIQVVTWIRDNKAVLREFAKNPNATEVEVNGQVYDLHDVQQIVYYAWKTLEKYASALGNFVQHSKIDTKKHGNSIIAINQYYDAYKKLFFPKHPDSSIWDIESLLDFANRTWVNVKTVLAVTIPSKILQTQCISARPAFIKAVIEFANLQSIDNESLNKNTLNKISRSLQTAIKSKYFVDYVQNRLCKENQTASEYIRDLFVGPNSMSKRLTRLKNQIEINPKYKRLEGNHLIYQIYSVLEEKNVMSFGREVERPAFITVLSNVDNSKPNEDLFIDAWEDLLKDEDVFVRKFARDLIVYSFFTSGEFKGWSKMFKYVPPSFIFGEIEPDYQSYSDYIRDVMDTSFDGYKHFFDFIAANNFMDSDIVRKVPMVNSDDTENFINYTNTIKIGKPIPLRQAAEEYITVRDGSGYTVSDYNLYKLVKYVNKDGKHIPVYARVKKRGYHNNSKYDIYEYGWDFKYGENEDNEMQKLNDSDALYRVSLFISSVDFKSPTVASDLEKIYFDQIDPTIETTEQAEDWSKKEGWSAQYFMQRVLPRIKHAWQMEFEVAEDQNVEADFKGRMDFSYGNNKRKGIRSNSTFEAIKNRERTATTRYDSDGHMDYWTKVKDGDIVEFTNGTESIKVKVTKPFTNLSTQVNTEESLSSKNTINIYAGTGENADLSNFAIRPFVDVWDGEKITFLSVEQAFQFAKEDYSKDSLKNKQIAKEILNTTDGKHLRRLGKSFEGFDSSDWDANSSNTLFNFIYESFRLNPEALQRLLSTGDAILTHNQDKSKCGKEFPRILMEVRDVLRDLLDNGNFTSDKNINIILSTEKSENDSERFNNTEQSLEVINSDKTILSNEELKEWNKQGVGPMPRILVASEHSDPAFHVQKILNVLHGNDVVELKPKYVKITKEEYDSLPEDKRWSRFALGGNIYFRKEDRPPLTSKDFNGLYLITKHDGVPMKRILETKIPKLIHFSITGLGNTEWEPGVMKYNDLLDGIESYIRQGLDPNSVTIRIDPIVPGVTKRSDIEAIVKRSSEMGIKRIRFSVMDVYKDIIPFLNERLYDIQKYYDKNEIDMLLSGTLKAKTGRNTIHAIQRTQDAIADFMLLLKDKYRITLGSCAEPMNRPGISKEGCLSVSAVNEMLGTSIEDKGTENNMSRKECSCFGGKFDMLDYKKDKCASHCIYCYAHHQNDKVLEYYNEDGTLKSNEFTKTYERARTKDNLYSRPNENIFGRKYLSESDRKYIKEHIAIYLNGIDIIKEFKNFIKNPISAEEFVNTDLLIFLSNFNVFGFVTTDDELMFLDMFKNISLEDFINQSLNAIEETYIYEKERYGYKSLNDMFEAYGAKIDLFYTDSRQTELFSEESLFNKLSEHKEEAEQIKKKCKGE